MTPKIRPDKLPIIDSFIAREPYPFLTKSWPGSNAKVESPGIPKNKPGKTSKNVCVTARDDIKTTINSGLIVKEDTNTDNKIAQIVFTWIPGINPEKNPLTMPKNAAKKNSIIYQL